MRNVTNSVKLESFIRIDKRLIPIEQVKQSLNDSDYIEGAIRMTIAGKELLSLDMWDCVDQLWAYLITGAEHAKHQREYSTYFPDQPIRISLRPLEPGTRLLVRVEAKETVEANVETSLFIASVADASEQFFGHLTRLLPQLPQALTRYRERAERLKKV
jgi:hypothetical protein